MIYIDPTEARAGTRLPHLPGAMLAENLEAVTGADMLISAWPAPAVSETLIREHVRRGALLVQRKSGLDLVHSLPNLGAILGRMWALGGRMGQMVLLTTGTLTCADDGTATIGGQPTSASYWSVVGALAAWNDRGGSHENLESDGLIARWVVLRERRLAEYAAPGGVVAECYPLMTYPPDEPARNDPLQLPIPVRDGRLVLAQLSGIGPKLASRVWEASGKNLGYALTVLTDLTSPDWCHIDGIGTGVIERIRQQLGLSRTQTLLVDDSAPPRIEIERAEQLVMA